MVRTDPRAGTPCRRGTTVGLRHLSADRGPTPSPAGPRHPPPAPTPTDERIIVGNYQCQDLATTRQQIEDAGLRVGGISVGSPTDARSFDDATWSSARCRRRAAGGTRPAHLPAAGESLQPLPLMGPNRRSRRTSVRDAPLSVRGRSSVQLHFGPCHHRGSARTVGRPRPRLPAVGRASARRSPAAPVATSGVRWRAGWATAARARPARS